MITQDGVFTVDDDDAGWEGGVMVFCDDVAATARALARAAPRLQRVLWDGRELSEPEWLAAGQAPLEQVCEYVSEPTPHDEGVSIFMDTQSELSAAAAPAFFAILAEELRAEGIDTARIAAQDI